MKNALSLLRRVPAALAVVLLTDLAGEIGALSLDMRHARLTGAGLALCVAAALAASRPRWLKVAGPAAGLTAAALISPPLRLGRLAARRGVAGYHAALLLLFACAALALGAALSFLFMKAKPDQSSESRS